MTFFVHDTLYYIVKRVKGTVEDDICEVKDDNIISHNFPRKPDKGVKLISTFRRNQQDSIWRLDGDWKTTETKKHGFYSISGKISLETEKDIEKSKLIPHLEELKLTNDVAFYQDTKKAQQQNSIASAKEPVKEKRNEPVIKDKKPAITSASIKESKKEEIAKTSSASEPLAEVKQTGKEVKKETGVVEQKPVADIAKETVKENKAGAVSATNQLPQDEKRSTVSTKTEPVAVIKQPQESNKTEKTAVVPTRAEPVATIKQPVNETRKDPVLIAKQDKKEEQKIQVKQEPQRTEQAVTQKPVESKKEIISQTTNAEVKKQEETATAVAKEKPQRVANLPEIKPIAPQAATFVAERKVAAQQVVFFKSDSLELSLYDNGEVDGDTVSVLINGELVLAKQGLKTSAIKKTIYVPAGKTDSLTLVLYAENLGKYPPNTGLLVVHDGDDVYQVRFSADLKQNAAVIFRRRQN